MSWITKVPGWPLLGNALEFGDTTGMKFKKYIFNYLYLKMLFEISRALNKFNFVIFKMNETFFKFVFFIINNLDYLYSYMLI